MISYTEAPVSLISPEGILSVLFDQYECLSFYYADLHKAFYNARKKEEYKDLLTDFGFSGSSISPFSRELSLALANMQVAALSRKNPNMVEYSTTSEFNNTYKILTENVDPRVIDRVKDMCKFIRDCLNHGDE